MAAEHSSLWEPIARDYERHAAVFQLEVPAEQFTPGLYTCQINIIDKVSGKFSFPRLTFYVRPDAQTAAARVPSL